MKGHILLDLDQTLIYGYPAEDFDFKKGMDKAKQFTFHDMEKLYIIFERPHVQEFLDYIFKNFTVSIWTAASKDYAMYVIEHVIKPKKKGRKLDYVFFSYHCDISDHLKSGTKDLRILWEVYNISGYTPENTIIIDDYDEVHDTQPKNCIIAPEFIFDNKNSEKDNFLKNIPGLGKLKKAIDSGKPIADIIKEINKKNNV